MLISSNPILSWGATFLLEILMLIFDTVVYGLAIAAICIFNGVARMDFFSTSQGAEIYTGLVSRIYGIIGIVMIFFFTYYLILMIINPDGKNQATSKLVTSTITSIVMIAFFPTLFHYMAVFQEHVLTEGTIMGIITGTSSGGDSDSMGRNTALIVYLSMYHPEGGGYESLVNSNNMDSNGNISVKTVKECEDESDASHPTCELWIKATNDFVNKSGRGFAGGITAFTLNHELINTIFDDEGSDYYPIIIVICGAVLAWFYISYSIDLGYRVVKLGFLQIIAPAPLVLRIFDKTRDTYLTWKKQLINTYLEIFVRVAIVGFIITIIQAIPPVVAGLFNTLGMSKAYIGFGIIALIFGIMKFGKELPKLVQDMFKNGSGLLSGIDWKPGFGRRMRENGTELIGYGKKAAKKVVSATNKVATAGLRAKRMGVKAAGALAGMKSGAGAALNANPQATKFNKAKTLISGAAKGASAGYTSGNNFKSGMSIKQGLQAAVSAGTSAGSTVRSDGFSDFFKNAIKAFDSESASTKSMEIDKITSRGKTLMSAFNDEHEITGKLSKLDEAQNFLLSENGKNGGKPITTHKYNEKGEIVGTRTYKDVDEIKNEIKALKKQAQVSTYKDIIKDGMDTKGLSDNFKTLLENASKTIDGVNIMDKSPKDLKRYEKGISATLDSNTINEINRVLGTNKYDPNMTKSAIKSQNEIINRENDLLDKEIADITAAKETARREEWDRIRANYSQDEMVRRSDEFNRQVNDALQHFDAEISSKQSQKRATIDESQAITVDIKDLQSFINDQYSKIDTMDVHDEAAREQTAKTLQSLHDLTGKINDSVKEFKYSNISSTLEENKDKKEDKK